MTSRLFSDSWYRVAGLKPALRSHLRIQRHRYRGQVWYVLQDQASGRTHRFPGAGWLLISAMNGERSVEALWSIARQRLGDAAPSQDELIGLLAQLHSADLLQCDVAPDVAELFERGERLEQSRRRRSYRNPLALRFALWDPGRFLGAIGPALRAVWSRWGAVVWLAVVAPALALVAPHWPELTHNLSDRVLAAGNLLLLWLVFPIIKAAHELGHAAAVKAGGGEVHELGVMLLVFVPVPYVDASAANAFPSKRQRALVGAAGMIVELFIAAIAFYVWLLAEPGLVRAVAFDVLVVAGVSTLVFNGNPLLRYDAYYILADLIEIPNLAQRSLRHWGDLIERHLFGARGDADRPAATRAERAWFVGYGFASSVYRAVITVSIVLFIAGQFFVVGVLLAIWAAAAMVVVPLAKGIRHLARAPALRKRRPRVVAVCVSAAAGLALVMFAVPLPFRSYAEGVVWLPEEATLRAGANAFFVRFLAAPGAAVAKGDILAQSRDPALEAQIHLLEAKVAESRSIYAAQFVRSRADADIAAEQLATEEAALERARERAAGLLVASSAEGVLTVANPADMPGRHYRKGDPLGHVLGRQRPLLRVAVPQASVDSVRRATVRVEVRFTNDPRRAIRGHIVREVPAGERELPSPVLGAAGGGELAVQPGSGRNGQALERIFQFDVALDEEPAATYFGSRAYVRFEHPPEPLGRQWHRQLRGLFLARFEV